MISHTKRRRWKGQGKLCWVSGGGGVVSTSCSTLRTLWVTAAPLNHLTVLLGHPLGTPFDNSHTNCDATMMPSYPKCVLDFQLKIGKLTIWSRPSQFLTLHSLILGQILCAFNSDLKPFLKIPISTASDIWICSNCVPIFITFVLASDLGRPKLSHKWLHCHNPERRCRIAFGPPSGPNLKCFAFPRPALFHISDFCLPFLPPLLRLKVHSIKSFSRAEKTLFFLWIIFYSTTRKF